MPQYMAIQINPDGTEGETLHFECDPRDHESYHAGMPGDGIVLTVDADGVWDFAREFIGGAVEVVRPQVDSAPVFLVDEDGWGKGLPLNQAHALMQTYRRLTGGWLVGPVVVIMRMSDTL